MFSRPMKEMQRSSSTRIRLENDGPGTGVGFTPASYLTQLVVCLQCGVEPRARLEYIGFQYRHALEVLGIAAPASLRANRAAHRRGCGGRGTAHCLRGRCLR